MDGKEAGRSDQLEKIVCQDVCSMKGKISLLCIWILCLSVRQAGAFKWFVLHATGWNHPSRSVQPTPVRLGTSENGTYQSAYEIEVYELVDGNEKLFWSTGKTISSNSRYVA